jgi:uncharacterized membrane protein (DUF106 family)
MVFLQSLNPILDPILRPLLVLGPFWTIVIISIIISLASNLAYKFLTNQTLMKHLKQEVKRMQKELKQLKDKPAEFAALQKKMMAQSMEMTKHSMKPTLFTMIPILLFFGWLATNLAFMPLMPGVPFDVTLQFAPEARGNVTLNADGLDILTEKTLLLDTSDLVWTLQGDAGRYILEFQHDGKVYEKKILITDEQEFENPLEIHKKDSALKTIEVGNKPLKPLGDFSIFGWRPGWFGLYFIISVAASLLIRKMMKLY